MSAKILNKLIIMNVLFITLFASCNEPKEVAVDMQFPDKKPFLLEFQKGLSPELLKEQVVFENYSQSMLGTSSANRIYANGDYYKIVRGSNTKKDSEFLLWKKVRVLSKNELKKVQKISNSSLVDFINEEHKLVGGAHRNIDWYFYFDQPKFIETQVRPLYSARSWNDLMARRSPKFVRKMNRILE